ncbi:MAG: hypothetical protein IPL35_04525, partial [Sphingobacteriales bacterium]|nr:hypothetical protein [Sphingobacteriales bacterium]
IAVVRGEENAAAQPYPPQVLPNKAPGTHFCEPQPISPTTQADFIQTLHLQFGDFPYSKVELMNTVCRAAASIIDAGGAENMDYWCAAP